MDYFMGSDRQSLAFTANVYGQIRDHAAGLTSPEYFLVGDSVGQIIERQACSILNSGNCSQERICIASARYALDLTAVRKGWS